MPVFVLTLEDPIKIVHIVMEKPKEELGKKIRTQQTKALLEAGFAPKDFQVPASVHIIRVCVFVI